MVGRLRGMYRLHLLMILALGACAQEAGRSTYLDQPFVASAEQQAIMQQQQSEADRVVAANLADQEERRRLAASAGPVSPFATAPDGSVVLNPDAPGVTPDERLVASLEAAIETAGGPVPEASAPSPLEPAGEATAGTPIVLLPEGAGTISDDSFATVTARETIESDAERLARLEENNIVLEAEPLPAPTTAANLAAFARATSHRIGQRVYPRGGARSSSSAARTCRQYGNPDEAQRAFLSRGGPEADPMKLDPDGDGFVCGWSPDPFRALAVPGG